MTINLRTLAIAAVALIACGCSTQTRSNQSILFDQLIASHDRFDGHLVRTSCVLTLFSEYTFFTPQGMPHDFETEILYYRSDGAKWKSDVVANRMIEEAKAEHRRFRSAHPEVAWPSIEIEVDVEGIFSATKPHIAYYLAPVRILTFHLRRNVGLNASGHLLVFPVAADEAEPGATDNPDGAQ